MLCFLSNGFEKFDANYGIPRKANEQYLPAYQAFWAWAGDVGQALFFALLGFIGAFLKFVCRIFIAGFGTRLARILGVGSDLACRRFFRCLFAVLVISFWTMSTSHGSARWAKISDLIEKKLVNKIKISPLPKNALPLAKVFGGRDLYLLKDQCSDIS